MCRPDSPCAGAGRGGGREGNTDDAGTQWTGMDVECPYCGVTVAVDSLEHHVRTRAGDGHGPSGSVPVEGVDSPWNLRLDVPDEPPAVAGDVPVVEYDPDAIRQGRCPSCARGVLALAGGDGFLASGRRRMICPNCGWETPEWVEIVD